MSLDINLPLVRMIELGMSLEHTRNGTDVEINEQNQVIADLVRTNREEGRAVDYMVSTDLAHFRWLKESQVTVRFPGYEYGRDAAISATDAYGKPNAILMLNYGSGSGFRVFLKKFCEDNDVPFNDSE